MIQTHTIYIQGNHSQKGN